MRPRSSSIFIPSFSCTGNFSAVTVSKMTICDPRELTRKDARLWHGSRPIDFVYNRLTDFALERPAQTALELAYLAGEVVVSPHPRAHALYADKRNLTLLCDESFLRETGVTDDAISTLVAPSERHVADTQTATALKADVRNYAYAGVVKLVAARLYQGQTTNFRTPAGGFAPVFTETP